MLLVVGLAYVSYVKYAGAVAPSDYGLKEGNTISAAGSNDPDVYIVNDWGYKRLFLNPVIFTFYGQLTGGFAGVKNVSPATRDAFTTSGLFRDCEVGSVNNNGKVYGVEVNGEDTGMLHWVNTSGAQAVADDPNFFKKVFCINDNEFNWYPKGSNYTSVNQVPSYARVPGSPVVGGNVNVSLASDNPSAASITRGATGVTYLKLNFSGSGVLSSLRVTRRGPGATGDFANIYLYEGAHRLTSGRTPSSSDGSVTFSNLNWTISGSRMLSVVADMNAATQGDVNYLSVDSSSDVVLSSGTIGGSFPVAGNNMAVTGQSGGTLTIATSGSLTNPNVGQSNVQIGEFKFTTATEGARISRMQLLQSGSMQSSNLSNVRAEVNGVKIADGVVTTDNYVVFDLSGSPFFIAKGDNRIIKIFGDISGNAKRAETVILYFEQSSDLLALGDQFGFGMTVSGSGSGTTGGTITLQGGILTLTFVGPSATNVSTSTTKTHLLDFDMTAAAAIELRKTTIVLCKDVNADGTYDSAVTASATAGFGDLNNVQIINRDTGVALVGPQDGSAFNTLSNSTTLVSATGSAESNACGSSKNGVSKQFTDVLTINSGQVLHLAIVADVKQSNSSVDNDLITGNAFKAVLFGYGTEAGTSGDTTLLKYAGTNTALKSSDVVPSGVISGNSMTVQGSSLTASLASTPSGTRTFVKGATNITALGINLTTALGNPVTVNTITITGYTGDDAGSTVAAGDANGLISSVRLIDATTGLPVGTLSSNTLSSDGKVQFTNMAYPIAGGTTKTLWVVVDLGGNTPGTIDMFKFDIAGATDVSATDQNSSTINSNNLINGTATTFTTNVQVGSVGTLATAASPDNPTKNAVYWGQADAPFSKFRLTSTNEGFYVERLNVKGTTGSTAATNIDSVKLTYKDKAGDTLTSSGALNSAGSISFAFSGDTRPYVPKDNTLDVAVSATMATANELYRATGVNFTLDLSGGGAVGTDEFRAVGEGSGSVVDASGISAVSGQTMYVYRSFPKFTGLAVSDPNATISVGAELYRFRVDAMGSATDGATVFFDGPSTAGSGSIKFAVLASGENTNTLVLEMRDTSDNSQVGTATMTANAGPLLSAASASFLFDIKDIEIPAGQSKTFVLKVTTVTGFAKPANTNAGRAADFVQILLRDESQGGLIGWTDKGGTSRIESNTSVQGILRDYSTTTGPRINFH